MREDAAQTEWCELLSYQVLILNLEVRSRVTTLECN